MSARTTRAGLALVLLGAAAANFLIVHPLPGVL